MKKTAWLFLLGIPFLLVGCIKMSDTQTTTVPQKTTKTASAKNKKADQQLAGNKLTSELPDENKEATKPKEPEELKKNRYFTVENDEVKYEVKDQMFLDFGGNNLIWVVLTDYTNKTDEERIPDDFYEGVVVSQTEKVLEKAKLPTSTEGEVTDAVKRQSEAVPPKKTVRIAMIYRVINYMPLNFSFDQDIFPKQKDVEITIN